MWGVPDKGPRGGPHVPHQQAFLFRQKFHGFEFHETRLGGVKFHEIS